MKTNFERWKEGLTPEEFVRGAGPIYDCWRCPLADNHKECVRRFGGGLCRKKFLAWANAPAIMTEEEKRVLCATRRKWSVVARDLRVAAKRAEFYLQMGLADIIEAQALDALDKACAALLSHCNEQWLACARDAVEFDEENR